MCIHLEKGEVSFVKAEGKELVHNPIEFTCFCFSYFGCTYLLSTLVFVHMSVCVCLCVCALVCLYAKFPCVYTHESYLRQEMQQRDSVSFTALSR